MSATNSLVVGRLARLGFEIERLAADHAAEPGGAGEHDDQIGAHRRIGMGRRVGDDVEGIGQQPVAGQNGGGLVEGLVDGGTATAQIVVVHRRQVVMDQRIAMDHFQRASRAENAFALDSEQPRGLRQQEGPQPLAAAERSIAHGFEQALGTGLFARQSMRLQQRVQHVFRRLGDRNQPGREFLLSDLSRHAAVPICARFRQRIACPKHRRGSRRATAHGAF